MLLLNKKMYWSALAAHSSLLLGALFSGACWDIGANEPTRAAIESQSGDTVPDGLSYTRLFVSPSSQDFARNPSLLKRIRAGPHGYFRFVSEAFSRVVCERLRKRWVSVPEVNLHGDAHLEQYAITAKGRGLTDFDRSTRGMAFLDHIRFGVSIHLACLDNGWKEQRESVVREFFRGYYAGLEDQQLDPPPPALVERIRATFAHDHARLLASAEGFMRPMERTREEIDAAMLEYTRQMRERSPELPSSFFRISRVGQLHLGIGSALDEKYLMRIEGATESPEDDLILEAKEIRELEALDCIEDVEGQPVRVLTGHNRIAYSPYQFVGFFDMASRESSQSKSFWVFAWEDDYEELSIQSSFRSLEDLKSIAYDVGVQLGLGHPKGMGYPDDSELRHTVARVTKQLEQDLHHAMNDLTLLTLRAWQEFCAETADEGGINR